MKNNLLRIIYRLLIVVVVSGIGIELILLSEVGLRALAFRHYGNSYYLWPPFFSRVFTPISNTFPGISGEKRFYINSLGMRGDEINPSQKVRILALGGSTTECNMLDESETWPFVLQEQFRKVYGNSIWIGNAGRRGATSRDHILHLKYLVPQVENVGTIVLLTGVNDFMFHLYDKYTPKLINSQTEANVEQLNHAFFIHPHTNYGIKGSALWIELKKIKVALLGRNKIFDAEGNTQLEWQRKRQAQKKITQLPDISKGLQEYRHNLGEIAYLAKAKHIQLILLTHPVLWKKKMTAEEESLLWFGCTNDTKYICFSSGALVDGMARYNQVVREVCHEEKLECIDLVKDIPSDATVFYDDVHFNQSGAEQVAITIFKTLKNILMNE